MDPDRNTRILALLDQLGAEELEKDCATTLEEVLEDAGVYGEPCWELAPEEPPSIEVVFQLPSDLYRLTALPGAPSAYPMHLLQAHIAQPIPRTAQEVLDTMKCGIPKPRRDSPNITPPSSTESPSRMVESQ